MSTESEILQWDRFYSGNEKLMRIPDIRLVRELAGVDPVGKAALVLGCGNGRHVILLRQLGWHVVAVDYSREALDRLFEWALKEGCEGHLITRLLDINDPMLSFLEDFAGKFDLVTAWSVLEYLVDDEIHNLLDWLSGVCAEEAQLIVWARGEKDRIHNPLFQSSDGFMVTQKRNENSWKFLFKLSPSWSKPIINERWETFGMFNEHHYLIRSGVK